MLRSAKRMTDEEAVQVRRLVNALDDIDYLHEHRFIRNRQYALTVVTRNFATTLEWLKRNRVRKLLRLV